MDTLITKMQRLAYIINALIALYVVLGCYLCRIKCGLSGILFVYDTVAFLF